jgi:hypothetical protein
MHGRWLLRPSAELNDTVLGILGRAQHLYGVELHAFTFLSNHFHLLATVRDAAQLASFMAHVNGNIARKVGRLHQWRERFWGRRYRAIVILGEEAQIGRLRYCLSQGCKEGLVARAEQWPGVNCVRALTAGAKLIGHWFDSTANHRGSGKKDDDPPPTMPYEVRLSPLPCWRTLDATAHRQECLELISQVETDARTDNDKAGRQPMGASAILAQNPHHLPPDEERTRAPFVHAADQADRQCFMQAYIAFAGAHRSAAKALRAGDRAIEFPSHSFPASAPLIKPTGDKPDPFWASLSLPGAPGLAAAAA